MKFILCSEMKCPKSGFLLIIGLLNFSSLTA